MEELVQLERKVQGVYDSAYRPLAERLRYPLPMTGNDAPGVPSVLFLGNHSSGKSSFINFLMGKEIQKTGLAPTDDGFTIITYGPKLDELDGQSVVTHPDLAYRSLQQHGPVFLSHLRLKTVPAEILKTITLIDSPGMIDAAGTAHSRGYDFMAGVRQFAEQADLILFFFDPDKPGTTGETMSIFTETLSGLEHKLLIVLNKVDLFANIRDFARTYGTLCWNLSKTIRTKDIPHIYNVYLPNAGGAEGRRTELVPLHDFDLSREEVVAEIRRAPTRRADNLVSDLVKHGQRLAVHARVCFEAIREYRAIRNRFWALIATILVITGIAVYFAWDSASLRTPMLILLVGVVAAGASWLSARFYLNHFRDSTFSLDGLDGVFERAYREELAFGERPDLRACWAQVRNQSLKTITLLGPSKAGPSFAGRKLLRKVESTLDRDVPKLRREIARRPIEEIPAQEEQETPGEPAGTRA